MHPLNETTAFNLLIGEVAEWSIAPVLKTDVLKGTGGSNPSLSAEKEAERLPFFTLEGMRTPERGFVIDEVACQSKNRINAKFWDQRKILRDLQIKHTILST